MRRTAERWLDSPRTVAVAAAISLGLGLFFTFVWAPHPWSWQGIDQYHDLARGLARGEPFSTTDVPWGYSYFVAACYVMFGERAWVPVVLQTLLNAGVPVLLYALVAPLAGRRTATLAALITGIFSFNTVYASTQASDAVCTTLFMGAVLSFAYGVREKRVGAFVLSGLLSGLVPQFRPNMILLPALAMVVYLALPVRSWRKVGHMAAYAALVALVLSPWIVRNYGLTGMFMPTSTHGGVQLWYGTLQVGPYLETYSDNPRAIFQSAAFEYTSLANRPIDVTAERHLCIPGTEPVTMVYWTDRAPAPQRISPREAQATALRFVLPGQPLSTTIYYYFEAPSAVWPHGGAANPRVYFVSGDHLGNLDRHDDLLDAFDVAALMRYLAWGDPLSSAHRLDLDGDGRIGTADLSLAVDILIPTAWRPRGRPAMTALDVTSEFVTLRVVDGSSLTVPRAFTGRVTDLEVNGEIAGALVTSAETFTAIAAAGERPPPSCDLLSQAPPNSVFYRREPHMMQRYVALAFDNIRRDPVAFGAASAYRALRLFVIRSTDNPATAYQYDWSGLAYGAGMVLSAGYLIGFLAGAVVAWRQGSALLWLLGPIAYVPLTICFVLTNMRYTVTVQPLMFAFVAAALVAALKLDPPGEGRPSRVG